MKFLCLFALLGSILAQDEENDRQCENCENASILIMGGESANGEFYSENGYEYLRNYLINEYGLGNFTAELIIIDDSLRLTGNDEGDCENIKAIVSSHFSTLNENPSASGYNILICQGSDICLPVEKCASGSELENVSILMELGFVSQLAPSIENDIFSLFAEYDGYYTHADEAIAVGYMESVSPFPRNLNLLSISHSNARKWGDAVKYFSFLWEHDIDTKTRRTAVYRQMIRALSNFIDDESVGIRRNTQNARDFIQAMSNYLKMESENRREKSLSEALQEVIIDDSADINYDKIINHEYVEDITSVEQSIDGFYLNIFSQVVRFEQTDLIASNWENVAAEYLTKIFAPTEKYNCDSIQNQILSDAISQLDGNQIEFYGVHGCEMRVAKSTVVGSQADWNGSQATMAHSDGYLWITPVQYSGLDVDDLDKLSCRLISPARIMQWMMSDSHRWQNLKLCHEFIGKKPCDTCGEEE